MNKTNILKEIKKIEYLEKKEHEKIDKEVELENEIEEVSKYVASVLNSRPMTGFSIQNRHFVAAYKLYTGDNGEQAMEVAAREQLKIAIKKEKVIKANVVVDDRYSLKENLIAAIKGLLGHITGHIKAEEL